MITLAYSIFDTKALQYHTPFFAPTDGAAVRMLQELVSDPNTMIGRHPSDFTLFSIGSYDDQKGVVSPQHPLRHVCDAVSLVKVQPELPFTMNGVQPPVSNGKEV